MGVNGLFLWREFLGYCGHVYEVDYTIFVHGYHLQDKETYTALKIFCHCFIYKYLVENPVA